MKRIVFTVDTLGVGGSEKSLVTLLNLLDYSKYSVDLLAFVPDGALKADVPDTVLMLPEIPFIKDNRNGERSFSSLLNHMRRYVVALRYRLDRRNLYAPEKRWRYVSKYYPEQDNEYDVAVAWGQGTPVYYIAERVVASKKVAIINCNLANYYDIEFEKYFFERFDNIVVDSDFLNTTTSKYFPGIAKKIITIHDILDYENINRKAELLNPFKGVREIRIVTVGRLVPDKGYFLAIAAAKEIKSRGAKFKWYILGEGPLRSELENMIKDAELEDAFVLLGEIENPYPYIKNATLYVQTSINEGYCIALAEARLLNTPIVTTDFAAAYEHIVDGKNGLISKKDPIEIVNCIEKICNDNKLKDQITEHLKAEEKKNKKEMVAFDRVLSEN